MTKLSGTLPGGDNNGLNGLARALTADPHKTAIIVAVVDCKSITIDTDTGDKVATVRIRRVEPIDPQDTDAAQRLLVRGLERRTGAVMLPMDLEDELTLLFANLVDGVDMETGELVDDAEAEDDTTDEAEQLPESEAEAEKLPEATPAEAAAMKALIDEIVPDEVLKFGQLTDEVTPPVTLETPKPKRVRKSRAKAVADAVAADEVVTPASADDEGLPWLKD